MLLCPDTFATTHYRTTECSETKSERNVTPSSAQSAGQEGLVANSKAIALNGEKRPFSGLFSERRDPGRAQSVGDKPFLSSTTTPADRQNKEFLNHGFAIIPGNLGSAIKKPGLSRVFCLACYDLTVRKQAMLVRGHVR